MQEPLPPLRQVVLALLVTASLVGALSPAIAATDATATLTGDATVDSARPTSKLGGQPTLRMDAAQRRSYVKFNVSGLSAAPKRATLRLYSLTTNSRGYEVHSANGSWSEATITFGNAPSVGALIATSGAVTKGTWRDIDVTSAVKGDGELSLALTSRSSTTVSVASKQNTNRALAPKLVLEPAADAATVLAPSVSPAPSDRPYVPYTADSFLRTPLPADAPVDAHSADGIAFVKSHPDTVRPYPVIRGLGSNKWGTPYFESAASDPIWKLTGSVPSAVSFLKTEGFHAPEILGTTLTGTSDSPFVVMDRAGVPTMPEGLTVWAAKAVVGPDHTIQVGAAGAFQHDSNGLDKRNPKSTSQKNFRSRGAIPDAMVIRKDLVAWAIANDSDLGHVLHMFWVETRTTDGYVSPMVGDESGKYGWGAEGMRIRIKPSVNLANRGLTPGGLVIARTLQRYGAYLGDNSGSETALKAEQDYGQWGGLLTEDALEGLTWDDFVFVQRGFGS